MKTEYADVQASIMVKYILGEKTLTVLIFKTGWRFPADQPVKFPLTLGFDNAVFGQVTAGGLSPRNMSPMIEFDIANELIGSFLKAFGDAQLLWIRFDEGTEKPWPAKMSGSRNAAKLFAGCVSNLIEAN